MSFVLVFYFVNENEKSIGHDVSINKKSIFNEQKKSNKQKYSNEQNLMNKTKKNHLFSK